MSYQESALARDTGIERASKGAGDTWLDAAVEAIAKTARECAFLTSNDVRKLCLDPQESRAWGGAFRRAATRGIIEATKEFIIPDRVSSHRRPMRVWKSMVYGGAK